MIALNVAFKYQKASKLAPLMYTENVFTLLSDAFIFNYTFILTDYIGITIVTVCLLIPAIQKMRADSD